VLELCDRADLVIHDAQYTEEEYRAKATWGHSTVAYATHVAAEAGARRLALFHHDPRHSDDDIDGLLAQARATDDARRLDEVLAAREGLVIDLGRA
jgi:ribonuclease BN (tRNA processing enzyme)